MKVLRVIITYQEIEYNLIKEIYTNINLVKQEIKDSFYSIFERP